MLVTECNIARRIFSGRAKIGGIADTSVGSNRQHLFDRKLGRIPKLDAVWQILAFVRQRVEWEKFRRIVPIAGGRRQFNAAARLGPLNAKFSMELKLSLAVIKSNAEF